jgi:ribonuclease P protein component
MLSREQRIAKKKEFDYIFSNGKSRYTKLLGVKLIKNSLTFNRFGLIISNKVSKLAIQRNTIRRRLYTQISALLPALKIGYDVIIIVLPIAKGANSNELLDDLRLVFKSLKLHD